MAEDGDGLTARKRNGKRICLKRLWGGCCMGECEREVCPTHLFGDLYRRGRLDIPVRERDIAPVHTTKCTNLPPKHHFSVPIPLYLKPPILERVSHHATDTLFCSAPHPYNPSFSLIPSSILPSLHKSTITESTSTSSEHSHTHFLFPPVPPRFSQSKNYAIIQSTTSNRILIFFERPTRKTSPWARHGDETASTYQ